MVEFYHFTSANKAKQELDGKEVSGKYLRVTIGFKEASTLVEVDDEDSEEVDNKSDGKKPEGLSDR